MTSKIPHHKVLIVEDEVSIQQMYKFRLEAEKFEVKVAVNGYEGLLLAESFMPDVILLDIRMPIMSGDEMLEKLRSKDWGVDIKVIILTNISKNEAPTAFRFLNIDRYIIKAHYTPKQVTETVYEVLGN